jgi:hypothetical protein
MLCVFKILSYGRASLASLHTLLKVLPLGVWDLTREGVDSERLSRGDCYRCFHFNDG